MLGEAQAAAYLDGRLRRAGLKVSADSFQSVRVFGWDGLVIASIVLLAMIVYRWLPMLGGVGALVAAIVAIWLCLRDEPVLLAMRRASQNIVGTRALAQRPQCRVVLLAPLDAPPLLPRYLQRRYIGEAVLALRAGLCVVAVCASLAGMLVGSLEVRLGCWYAGIVLAALLGAMGGMDVWLGRRPASPGAANHAGALAVLLACAEELVKAERVELWAVGVGASTMGSGLGDLLRRYPFERDSTVFVTLESLGRGDLAYVTRSGLVRPQAGPPDLPQLLADAEQADPLIDAVPRSVRLAPTMLGWLRRAGWRAVGVMCLDADGFPPAYASADDLPASLDAAVLDRAVRFVLSIVRKIDHAAEV
ncbi:hypothetical protein F8S13_06655 [Chloroflexia bacterium SDU3-3]|nr:hypothetical protein F8S13_06655 [Chloroflexia bacterium SDU3-3]